MGGVFLGTVDALKQQKTEKQPTIRKKMAAMVQIVLSGAIAVHGTWDLGRHGTGGE